MDVLIIGAGGHGRVVLEILRAQGQHQPVAFVDSNDALHGTEVAGVPVVGASNKLPKLRKQVAGAIVAIGDGRSRLSHAALLVEHGFELVTAIHPTAYIAPSAMIGKNVVIAPGAMINTEARICDSVIVNTGAVVEHDCQIDDGAHIGPAAAIAGRSRVGQGSMVGLGSRIIQCIQIGRFVTVGAGAVVIDDVEDHLTVVGVPARPLVRAGTSRF